MTTHRSLAVSVAIRVLVVGAAVVCTSAAQDRDNVSCRGALGESSDLDLLQEGITIIPQSHVSVSKTADVLLVHVLKGEVLFTRRETAEYPTMVTAGDAQLRNIHAVVCVKVLKERTDVSVLDGMAELSEFRAEGDQQGMGGLTLRAGDQVELRRVGQGLEFRFGDAGADSAHCARSTQRLWELAGNGAPGLR
jgi:ferric-dicitrate binding protein FerR (iron transport regulator)